MMVRARFDGRAVRNPRPAAAWYGGGVENWSAIDDAAIGVLEEPVRAALVFERVRGVAGRFATEQVVERLGRWVTEGFRIVSIGGMKEVGREDVANARNERVARHAGLRAGAFQPIPRTPCRYPTA